jgi:hypothetical protein
MSLFKIILRLIRLALLLLFLFYWTIFIGYTVAKLIEGGPSEAVAYFRYVVCENRLDPCQWSWGALLFAQSVYLVITLLLCFFEFRSWRKQ